MINNDIDYNEKKWNFDKDIPIRNNYTSLDMNTGNSLLNSLFRNSLAKSAAIFSPSPPFRFTVRFHIKSCLSLDGRQPLVPANVVHQDGEEKVHVIETYTARGA